MRNDEVRLASRREILVGVAAGVAARRAAAMSAPDTPAAFKIVLDGAVVADLRRRLSDTHWADANTEDWRYGTGKGFLEQLLTYWRDRYDVAAAVERLNELPQFKLQIDGHGIHYLHLKGRGPSPKPLLLMNGWPSSFVEYRKLAPMLADPAGFGGDPNDAFDVVMPALPGFGFSDAPSAPYAIESHRVFAKLMTEHLGYRRFLASGTDIGAGVATRLALARPDAVAGIHIASVVDPPLAENARPLSAPERAYRTRVERWDAEEGAYAHLQSTRPQTLAYALADSPAGLASWIVEKFWFWSDHGQNLFATFAPEMLVDTLMIYWITNTIGSSMRYYYDVAHYRPPLTTQDRVAVPTAICMWPKDLVTAPRDWAERFYNVKRFTTPSRGGHFPAWEAPELYAADLRAFAGQLGPL